MIRLAILITSLVLGNFLTACTPPEKAAETRMETPVSGYMGITGEVIRHKDFASKFVIPRHIEVWLPPSYRMQPNKTYPVLYMHDGQNLYDPALSKYSKTDWGIDEAMTTLISQGKVREAIVVGAWSTHKRNNEYFPRKAVNETNLKTYQKEIGDFDPEQIESDAYLQFMISELKPFIDNAYRTKPGRADTVIMGSSLGGLISAYAISEYPEIFGAAGGVSTHFPLGDGAIVEYFSDKLPDPKTHKLYFDYGTETLDHNYEPYQDKMDAAIIAAGYVRGQNWMTKKFQGHEHSEKAWRARVHIPLVFLLGKPKDSQ